MYGITGRERGVEGVDQELVEIDSGGEMGDGVEEERGGVVRCRYAVNGER